jgi:hypothetical protein
MMMLEERLSKDWTLLGTQKTRMSFLSQKEQVTSTSVK